MSANNGGPGREVKRASWHRSQRFTWPDPRETTVPPSHILHVYLLTRQASTASCALLHSAYTQIALASDTLCNPPARQLCRPASPPGVRKGWRSSLRPQSTGPQLQPIHASSETCMSHHCCSECTPAHGSARRQRAAGGRASALLARAAVRCARCGGTAGHLAHGR